MAAPVCLRSAFGACRPSRSTQLSFSSALGHHRAYADQASQIKGIPKSASRREQKKILDQVPEQTPPKRDIPSSTTTTTTSASTTHTPRPSTAAISPAAQVQSATTEEAPKQTSKRNRPIPANLIAAYRAPLKHQAPYGVPVASLQLRSYSVRSLEFFSDFAMRAAYYLNLPATGPVHLPKRIERWTMPKANFVHKKSQENFERITLKRLITILDGEKSAVEVWLAVLRKWQFYGVGMKANVWEWEGLDVASKMDKQAKDLEKDVDAILANFGWNKSVADSRSLDDMFNKQGSRRAGAPMTELRDGARESNPAI